MRDRQDSCWRMDQRSSGWLGKFTPSLSILKECVFVCVCVCVFVCVSVCSFKRAAWRGKQAWVKTNQKCCQMLRDWEKSKWGAREGIISHLEGEEWKTRKGPQEKRGQLPTIFRPKGVRHWPLLSLPVYRLLWGQTPLMPWMEKTSRIIR